MDPTAAAHLLELTESHNQWTTESAYVCVCKSINDEETTTINIVETMGLVGRVKWVDPLNAEDLYWFPTKFDCYPCLNIITDLRLVFKKEGFKVIVDRSEKRNNGKVMQVRVVCSRYRLSQVRLKVYKYTSIFVNLYTSLQVYKYNCKLVHKFTSLQVNL